MRNEINLKKNQFPEFANINGTAVRHVGNGVYFRDAGNWKLDSGYANGKLTAKCPDMPWIHENELIEITRDEWEADNEGYVNNRITDKMSRFEKNPPASEIHYEIHMKNGNGEWCIAIMEEEGKEDEFLMLTNLDEALSVYKKLLEDEAKKGPDEEKFELRIASVLVFGFPSGYVPSEIELAIGL